MIAQRVLFRRDQFDGGLDRPRHHRLELFELRVEAERLELGERVVGDLLRRGLAGDVRLARHRLHVFLQPRRIRNLAELLFALPLRRDRIVREAANRPVLRVRLRDRERERDDEQTDAKRVIRSSMSVSEGGRTSRGCRALGREESRRWCCR